VRRLAIAAHEWRAVVADPVGFKAAQTVLDGLAAGVEQRATDQFLKVLGPTGLVVSIAGWMLDPMVCGGMAIGRPRVDLAALIELNRLLRGAPNPAHSRIDDALIREKCNETSQIAVSDTLASAEDPLFRQRTTRGGGRPRAGQSRPGSGSDPDAGGRSE
jgi:hypothetical protein